MADGITIEVDVDDVLESFDVARRDRNKVKKQAMGDAAKKTATFVKGRTPARWKSLTKGTSWISGEGTVGASFGMTRKKGEDWFKAYWLNYGTYSKRDPEHKFRYARKRRTASWGNGGKPNTTYYHFFENAIPGWERKFSAEFTKALQKRIDKLFKR